MSRRNQGGGVASSDENLANRLRPGVSNSTKLPGGPPGIPNKGMPPGGNNTFQEELMRLIDPDVSLAELEHTLGKVSDFINTILGSSHLIPWGVVTILRWEWGTLIFCRNF